MTVRRVECPYASCTFVYRGANATEVLERHLLQSHPGLHRRRFFGSVDTPLTEDDHAFLKVNRIRWE